jgi:hypothetical protein
MLSGGDRRDLGRLETVTGSLQAFRAIDFGVIVFTGPVRSTQVGSRRGKRRRPGHSQIKLSARSRGANQFVCKVAQQPCGCRGCSLVTQVLQRKQ